MRLSIIIPCYNLENYICRCLDTVLDQDIPEEDYEVIVVDDGSSDHTPELLANLAKDHPNIRIITQENQGVGMARNTGILASKGKYIWFVDGDDWVTTRSLGSLLHLAELHDVDILRFNYVHLAGYEPPKPLKEQGSSDITFYSPSDFLRKKIKRKFFLVCQLMKREIIIENNIRLQPLQMCEDVPFLAEYITHAKKIGATDWNIYYYYDRHDSVVNTIRPKRSRDTFIAYEQLREIVAPYMHDKCFASYMKRLIMTRIISEFKMYLHNGTPEEQKILLDSYKESGLEDFSIAFTHISLKKIFYAIVLKLHPDSFFHIGEKKKKRKNP